MPTVHGVTFDDAQRLLLEGTVCSGTASARTVIRARIRTMAATGQFRPGWIGTEIADALNAGLSPLRRLAASRTLRFGSAIM